jgi:hypothetical protein
MVGHKLGMATQSVAKPGIRDGVSSCRQLPVAEYGSGARFPTLWDHAWCGSLSVQDQGSVHEDLVRVEWFVLFDSSSQRHVDQERRTKSQTLTRSNSTFS